MAANDITTYCKLVFVEPATIAAAQEAVCLHCKTRIYRTESALSSSTLPRHTPLAWEFGLDDESGLLTAICPRCGVDTLVFASLSDAEVEHWHNFGFGPLDE